jgi:hypothetical protein
MCRLLLFISLFAHSVNCNNTPCSSKLDTASIELFIVVRVCINEVTSRKCLTAQNFVSAALWARRINFQAELLEDCVHREVHFYNTDLHP